MNKMNKLILFVWQPEAGYKKYSLNKAMKTIK